MPLADTDLFKAHYPRSVEDMPVGLDATALRQRGVVWATCYFLFHGLKAVAQGKKSTTVDDVLLLQQYKTFAEDLTDPDGFPQHMQALREARQLAERWLSTFPDFPKLRRRIQRQPNAKKLLRERGIC